MPPIDKFSVTSVTTFLFCWMKGTTIPRPKRSVLLLVLSAIFVISPIFTSLNNNYELSNAKGSLPGFYPLDAMKYCIHNLIVLAPFFVGLRFLSSTKSRELLLRAFPFAGVLYSIPMLFEVRMSPQLHRWVYGYFPHSWAQQVRDGGFRPVVFLGHGLEVALFASLAVIAALVAVRAGWLIAKRRAALVAGYLALVLLLCKTLGAAIYAVLAAPVILMTRPRTWLTVAACLSLIVGAYPILRSQNLVPLEKILSLAGGVSADRASSFQYRLENEQLLLSKANEKPLFGWGTWGRNRVYEARSGDDLTITDGAWIIVYGSFGAIGYFSMFGLFAVVIFRARSSIDRQLTRENMVTAGLGLMLAMNLINQLPNASMFPFIFLMAGAIAGRSRSRQPSLNEPLKNQPIERSLTIAA